MKVKGCKRIAGDAGHSARTIERAAQDLGLRVNHVADGQGGHHFTWSLAVPVSLTLSVPVVVPSAGAVIARTGGSGSIRSGTPIVAVLPARSRANPAGGWPITSGTANGVHSSIPESSSKHSNLT